jgi:hypothetical protein
LAAVTVPSFENTGASLRKSSIVVRARTCSSVANKVILSFPSYAGTRSGAPARKVICRATFGPPPAWRAQPQIESSICSGWIFARRRLSLATAFGNRRSQIGGRPTRE